MKKLLTLLVVLCSFTVFGQDESDNTLTQGDLYFDQEQFGEEFVVKVESSDLYNYFVTDLTKFTSWLERSVFLNLMYKDGLIICIDSDISKDQLWFKAPIDEPVDEVNCLFKDYKSLAEKKTADMTEKDRNEWREKNKKLIQ